MTKGRALHMLKSIDVRPIETACGRVAAGHPLGRDILTFTDKHGGEFEATVVSAAVTCRKCRRAMERAVIERPPCEHCDDSGWREFASGGIWTGEGITTRQEVCDCPCGQSVQEELDRGT